MYILCILCWKTTIFLQRVSNKVRSLDSAWHRLFGPYPGASHDNQEAGNMMNLRDTQKNMAIYTSCLLIFYIIKFYVHMYISSKCHRWNYVKHYKRLLGTGPTPGFTADGGVTKQRWAHGQWSWGLPNRNWFSNCPWSILPYIRGRIDCIQGHRRLYIPYHTLRYPTIPYPSTFCTTGNHVPF